jgi:hypothetical protein
MLITGTSSGTVAAECTAIVGRLAVRADTVIVA